MRLRALAGVGRMHLRLLHASWFQAPGVQKARRLLVTGESLLVAFFAWAAGSGECRAGRKMLENELLLFFPFLETKGTTS